MLTVGDIKKLVEVFATRDEVERKLEELVTKVEFDSALSKLDAIESVPTIAHQLKKDN